MAQEPVAANNVVDLDEEEVQASRALSAESAAAAVAAGGAEAASAAAIADSDDPFNFSNTSGAETANDDAPAGAGFSAPQTPEKTRISKRSVRSRSSKSGAVEKPRRNSSTVFGKMRKSTDLATFRGTLLGNRIKVAKTDDASPAKVAEAKKARDMKKRSLRVFLGHIRFILLCISGFLCWLLFGEVGRCMFGATEDLLRSRNVNLDRNTARQWAKFVMLYAPDSWQSGGPAADDEAVFRKNEIVAGSGDEMASYTQQAGVNGMDRAQWLFGGSNIATADLESQRVENFGVWMQRVFKIAKSEQPADPAPGDPVSQHQNDGQDVAVGRHASAVAMAPDGSNAQQMQMGSQIGMQNHYHNPYQQNPSAMPGLTPQQPPQQQTKPTWQNLQPGDDMEAWLEQKNMAVFAVGGRYNELGWDFSTRGVGSNFLPPTLPSPLWRPGGENSAWKLRDESVRLRFSDLNTYFDAGQPGAVQKGPITATRVPVRETLLLAEQVKTIRRYLKAEREKEIATYSQQLQRELRRHDRRANASDAVAVAGDEAVAGGGAVAVSDRDVAQKLDQLRHFQNPPLRTLDARLEDFLGDTVRAREGGKVSPHLRLPLEMVDTGRLTDDQILAYLTLHYDGAYRFYTYYMFFFVGLFGLFLFGHNFSICGRRIRMHFVVFDESAYIMQAPPKRGRKCCFSSGAGKKTLQLTPDEDSSAADDAANLDVGRQGRQSSASETGFSPTPGKKSGVRSSGRITTQNMGKSPAAKAAAAALENNGGLSDDESTDSEADEPEKRRPGELITPIEQVYNKGQVLTWLEWAYLVFCGLAFFVCGTVFIRNTCIGGATDVGVWWVHRWLLPLVMSILSLGMGFLAFILVLVEQEFNESAEREQALEDETDKCQFFRGSSSVDVDVDDLIETETDHVPVGTANPGPVGTAGTRNRSAISSSDEDNYGSVSQQV